MQLTIFRTSEQYLAQFPYFTWLQRPTIKTEILLLPSAAKGTEHIQNTTILEQRKAIQD